MLGKFWAAYCIADVDASLTVISRGHNSSCSYDKVVAAVESWPTPYLDAQLFSRHDILVVASCFNRLYSSIGTAIEGEIRVVTRHKPVE